MGKHPCDRRRGRGLQPTAEEERTVIKSFDTPSRRPRRRPRPRGSLGSGPTPRPACPAGRPGRDPSAPPQAQCVPKVRLLPALNHAPIEHLAIVNVPAECTAITHLVEHDPGIRIVDHELTTECQMISKRLFRISR